uniref:Variable surface protein n=1 Tax=Panagrolaimus sp. PS1159 TaxID=55785 RepID=A0AC35FFG8_9BILA
MVNLVICDKIYKKNSEKSDYISDLIYAPCYASGLMPDNKYFNLKDSCDALNQEIEEISNFGEKYQNYFSPNYNLKNAKPVKFHLNSGIESMQLQRDILKAQLEIQNSLRIPCIYQYAKYEGIPYYNKLYCRAKKAIFIPILFIFAAIFLTYATIKEIFDDFENLPIDIKIVFCNLLNICHNQRYCL